MLRQVSANTKFLGRQKAKLLTWPPEKHTTLLSLTLFERGQSKPELKLPETEAIPGPSRDTSSPDDLQFLVFCPHFL